MQITSSTNKRWQNKKLSDRHVSSFHLLWQNQSVVLHFYHLLILKISLNPSLLNSMSALWWVSAPYWLFIYEQLWKVTDMWQQADNSYELWSSCKLFYSFSSNWNKTSKCLQAACFGPLTSLFKFHCRNWIIEQVDAFIAHPHSMQH